MTKKEQSEQKEARETLLRWLKPGDTVYTILDHVSRSGMQRRIRLVIFHQDEKRGIVDLHPNYSAAKLLGRKQAPRESGKGDGIIISGCGMDMGFELVYSLSRKLFGDGYALNHRWL